MRSPRPTLSMLLAILIVTPCLVPTGASAGELLGRLQRLFGEAEYEGTEPCTGRDCAIECLAEHIDWLEHYIDTYGSVVAKQPDIWGEARLTKHRDEYERIMFQELNQFKSTINAAITQGDSSFLAQAIALSNAAAGATVTPAPSETAPVAVANAQLVAAEDPSEGFTQLGFATKPDPAEPSITLEPVTYLDQMSRYLKHLHELRRINEGDDTSDSPGYSLNLIRIPVSILPGKLTREGFGAEVTITAEPVISDDLMPTTFRNLAVNDVVDQFRLPVTRVAEGLDELEAEAVKKEEFKQSLEKSIGEYCSRRQELVKRQQEVAEAKAALRKLECLAELIEDANEEELDVLLSRFTPVLESMPLSADQKLQRTIEDFNQKTQQFKSNRQQLKFDRQQLNQNPQKQTPPGPSGIRSAPPTIPELQRALADSAEKVEKSIRDVRKSSGQVTNDVRALIARAASTVKEAEAKAAVAEEEIASLQNRIAALSQKSLSDYGQLPTSSGRSRRARHPVPPSQTVSVYGSAELRLLAEKFRGSYFGRHVRWNGCESCKDSQDNAQECRVNVMDVQHWLDAETDAAYELLSEPDHLRLFVRLAAPSSKLANQIRNGHVEPSTPGQLPGIAQYRHYFFTKLHEHRTTGMQTPAADPVVAVNPVCYTEPDTCLFQEITGTVRLDTARNSVEALAWAIVVESALLNERLNRDVRKLAEATQAHELKRGRDHLFFLPDSVTAPTSGLEDLRDEFQLATDVFKDYVRRRWPIHVFAVDPVNQDQNVADLSQRKRELQFALALGFATGQIGVNSLTQFSRQLETQVETISLNRTIVGFGHGTDTFGWRFYPRVQSLDVPGTFGAIRETLCGASRDYDLRHRRLESGQRECIAVVLMPSFVPYADFDIRSNWFKLTNPKNAALTMKDSVKLSRAVTAMRNSKAQCAECQHLYREGELRRLFKRVDQLDRELPLQTERALVPYENTLGGFEMFNTGVTDLSPELIGWYGAPGINTDADYQCGCYQACGTIRAQCTDADSCNALNEALGKVNATLAQGRADAAAGDKQSPLPICEGAGTTLFLVGDNFSVHDTKVIAGGVCIPHVRLISRELMRVTIPPCVNTVELCENGRKDKYVSIYVATPYGVTNHLHVPVKKPEAEVKLADAVKQAVAAEIATLDVPRRIATVGAADSDNKTVKVTARVTAGGARLALTEDAQSGARVSYQAPFDPRFRDKTVTVKASVVRDKQFITPLAFIKRFRFETSKDFAALGEGPDPAGGKTLLWHLSDVLQVGDFPADRTLKLKIVYYAGFNTPGLPARLKEEVDLEIKLIAPAQAGSANHAPSGEGTNGDSEVRRRPTRLPMPDQDCGCGDKQASSGGLPASWIADRGPRVPAQLTQFSEANPTTVGAIEGVLDVSEIPQRLERIEATLQSAIEQQAASATPQADVPPATTAPSSQSQVDVTVNYPDSSAEQGRKKWFDVSQRPLLKRIKTGVGEHWRNVRDHLPGN